MRYLVNCSRRARVAQLDRALVSGTKGRGFESLRAYQIHNHLPHMSIFARPTARSFFLVLFGLYFVLLVGGFTLTHLSGEYTLAQQMAATMLIGAVAVSFFLSSLTCMRFCFHMSLRQSAIVTMLLLFVGLAVYSVGGIMLTR